jgi:hypothetical protein
VASKNNKDGLDMGVDPNVRDYLIKRNVVGITESKTVKFTSELNLNAFTKLDAEVKKAAEIEKLSAAHPTAPAS